MVTAVHADEGVSGAKGRDQRPAFDALLKSVTRREIDVVAAWSVDRTGFGGKEQKLKRTLILDVEQYRYQRFISDLAGMDIHQHGGDPL